MVSEQLGIYFHRVLSDPYSDVLCSEECQTKKLLVCCKTFAFFKAILNVYKHIYFKPCFFFFGNVVTGFALN